MSEVFADSENEVNEILYLCCCIYVGDRQVWKCVGASYSCTTWNRNCGCLSSKEAAADGGCTGLLHQCSWTNCYLRELWFVSV